MKELAKEKSNSEKMIEELSRTEMVDLYLRMKNDLGLMAETEKTALQQLDQVTIQDVIDFLPEIDPEMVLATLQSNKEHKRISRMLANETSRGYGGLTLFKIAKVIIDSCDGFDTEKIKNRIEKVLNVHKHLAFAFDPRDDWSKPLYEELGIEETATIFLRYLVIKSHEGSIKLKTFDYDAWDWFCVEEFKSSEKLDGFIDALITARENVFGPKTA